MNHEFERKLEGRILLRIQKMHNPILDKIMLLASIFGNGGLIWVAVILGYIIAGRRREAMILIISLALCAFLNNIIIKSFFKRARPCDIFGNYPPLIKRPWVRLVLRAYGYFLCHGSGPVQAQLGHRHSGSGLGFHHRFFQGLSVRPLSQ